MASESAQSNQQQGNQPKQQAQKPQSEQRDQEGGQGNEQQAQNNQEQRDRSRGERRSGSGERALARRGEVYPEVIFDPSAATRVALLRLARRWRASGSTYQALKAYTHVLTRYPGTGVASAATEELLAMAEELEEEGKFYTALNILNKLERLA
ncbi:MAG: hypothetical protein M3281_09895 [Chloroflexota bacterium]|nr:hypothetical protein [Chloroflexota bacterium]